MLTLAFFFFNDTATTEIYTLSLHDALPIYEFWKRQNRLGIDPDSTSFKLREERERESQVDHSANQAGAAGDRKSTRLNSSHTVISYAVFCLKKKRQAPHVGSSSRRRATPRR